MKQILQKIYYHIKALEVKPDHIHVFVDVTQTAASFDVLRTFKDISAIELFKAFPQLIQLSMQDAVFYGLEDILYLQ